MWRDGSITSGTLITGMTRGGELQAGSVVAAIFLRLTHSEDLENLRIFDAQFVVKIDVLFPQI